MFDWLFGKKEQTTTARIFLKRGKEENMFKYQDSIKEDEIVYCTDKPALWVKNNGEMVKLCKGKRAKKIFDNLIGERENGMLVAYLRSTKEV